MTNKTLRLDTLYEDYFINDNSEVKVKNILKLLDNNICSFSQIVDKFKDFCEDHGDSQLNLLFYDKTLHEKLVNSLTKDDLKYVLSKIDSYFELQGFCNSPWVKDILSEMILDKEDVERFDRIISRWNWWGVTLNTVSTVFDMIKYYNRDDEKLSNLIDLIQFLTGSSQNGRLSDLSLDKKQKSELVDLLKSNEKSRNIFLQMIEANTLTIYTFDQILGILTKDDRKKKQKINF